MYNIPSTRYTIDENFIIHDFSGEVCNFPERVLESGERLVQITIFGDTEYKSVMWLYYLAKFDIHVAECARVIQFVKTPVIIDGQKYYQVKCIREYKCGFNKRIIKSGELGGYFHELSIDENEPSVWIEQDCIVGAPICETVYAQPLQRERFLHSEMYHPS